MDTTKDNKKQEIKKTLSALTCYLERLEKYLKNKYDVIDAKQTDNNINNSDNSCNGIL